MSNPADDLSLYGWPRSTPVWWVRLRGMGWLRVGLCPCCYSSPPRSDCPICRGDYDYAYRLDQETREVWALTWAARCSWWRKRRA